MANDVKALPVVAWTMDAEQWGAALNEAAWEFIHECPEKSVLLFNNCKAPLRAAILKYAKAVRAANAKSAPIESLPVVAYGYANTRPTGERHSLMMVRLDNSGDQYPELALPLVLQSDAESALAELRAEVEQEGRMREETVQSLIGAIRRAIDAETRLERARGLLQGAEVLFAPLCKDATAWTWLDGARAFLGEGNG